MDPCFACCSANADFRTSCGHAICFSCFGKYVCAIKLYPVPCFVCLKFLPDEECKQNISDDILGAYEETKAHFICMRDNNKLPCLNIDCIGIFDSEGKEIESFICGECNEKTCLKCRAVHKANETCQEWEANNKDLIASRRRAAKEMKNQKRSGHGMDCVQCGLFIQKLEGCNGLSCPSCLTSLCFKTKKRRWGPGGVGDLSDGCKCDIDAGKPCHARCWGCNTDADQRILDGQNGITLRSAINFMIESLLPNGM